MSRFRLSGPRSLRSRLILGAALLAIIAVAVAEAAGLLVVHNSLMSRVDDQLTDFHLPDRLLKDAAAGKDIPEPAGKGGLPTDFRVHLYGSDGRLVNQALGSAGEPGARLPADFGRLGLRAGEPSTVEAGGGDGSWRVLLLEEAPDGVHAVAALSLDTVDEAIENLLWVSVLLLVVVILAIVLVGHAVVRIGLLPLTRMEGTAERIATGDLELNLPDPDPRTETGRLSGVLNTVLARLRDALRRREESEARLRRFLADAGHELRTPLTSIQGFAEYVLQEQRLSDEERQQAQRLIVQHADRMSRLIDDLVLLAKLDREPGIDREPVDLLSVAADSIGSAAVRHPDRPVTLGTLGSTCADDAGELDVVETTGDSHRLRQVAANLLANALLHTPAGTPVRVRVGSARAGADAGGTDRPGRSSPTPPLAAGTPVCVLEVADAGRGLKPEDATRVFERFYRADPARTAADPTEGGYGSGTGLGLAIAAAIAEGHGGRLELDTARGEGCTFRLVLPAVQDGAR